jgi:Bacteriophage head to tail connecting protein
MAALSPQGSSGFLNYEAMGASLLADVPPLPNKKPKPNPAWNLLRGKEEERLAMLRNWRLSWLYHWELIAQNVNPRRSMWLSQGTANIPTPNSFVRGRAINQSIIDETGTIAMRTCAAGIMSGLTSESRPWFKLGVWRKGIPADQPSRQWLEAVEDILYDIMAGSNFYASVMQQDEDLVTFGTSPMIIYEDADDVIRCYVPIAGEYYLANSASMRPETFYRMFLLNCSQIVEMFGLDNCPPDVQGMWRTKGASLENERIVAHAVEPNFDVDTKQGAVRVVDRKWPFRELYWVWGASSDVPLSARGFEESPVCTPRWATSGNDAYGRSPCMDALPGIMQLQVEQARLMEAIEKQVRPPLKATTDMREQPSSVLPGHVTYVTSMESGIGPIYTVNPDIKGMTENILDCRQRVKSTLFNDVFMAVTERSKDETAYEIAKVDEERLQMLGPVIQRLQNENLKPAISRIYKIAARKGLLPPVPDSLKGVPLDINYISIMNLAQKATRTASMERYAKVAIEMAGGGLPDALYSVNSTGFMDEYGKDLDVPVEAINDKQTIMALKKAAAQQKAATQQLQAGMGAAKAAGDVGLTVGGGLQSILNPQGNA